MRDMNFLKNLGSESTDTSGDQGSMINGMTAEQYAASLDEAEEYGEPEPSYDQSAYAQPSYQAPQPNMMGGSEADLSDLPLTEISDMDAPIGGSQSASAGMGMGGTSGSTGQPAGFASTNRYGGNPSASSQPAGYGSSSRYSANSYGNTSYTAPDPDFRTLRQRQIAATAANENLGMGIIGGLLGAALGTVVWALIAWAGYISWVGAIAIVAGTFFGYLLFAKDIGRGGALVVCILIIAAVFCGNRLGFAIMLHDAVNKDFREDPTLYESDFEVPTTMEIFKDAGYYIDLLGVRKDYNSDMMTSYLFTGVAAAAFFVKRFK